MRCNNARSGYGQILRGDLPDYRNLYKWKFSDGYLRRGIMAALFLHVTLDAALPVAFHIFIRLYNLKWTMWYPTEPLVLSKSKNFAQIKMHALAIQWERPVLLAMCCISRYNWIILVFQLASLTMRASMAGQFKLGRLQFAETEV